MTQSNHRAAIIFADGVTQFIQVEQQETLLDAAFRQGITLPLDCREGVCATCRGRCESGRFALEYVDEDALSADELAQGYMLACQTRLLSDGAFYFDSDSSVCSIVPQRYTARVSSVTPVAENVVRLEMALDPGQPALHYLPGQYARIEIPGGSGSRAYSWASACTPQENRMAFLIRLLAQGSMSDYLRQRCQPGDTLSFSAPFGAFYLREVTRPLLLIAGGTGLSPLLSMLESLAQSGCTQPIRLWYGVRFQQELCELERLDALTQQLSDFSYQRVVSRPDDSWHGKRGRITDVLEASQLQQPFDAYLCGPPAMVVATCDWLESQPVAEHRVCFERFVSS